MAKILWANRIGGALAAAAVALSGSGIFSGTMNKALIVLGIIAGIVVVKTAEWLPSTGGKQNGA